MCLLKKEETKTHLQVKYIHAFMRKSVVVFLHMRKKTHTSCAVDGSISNLLNPKVEVSTQ